MKSIKPQQNQKVNIIQVQKQLKTLQLNKNQDNPTIITTSDNKVDNPANHDHKGTYNQQNMESGVANKIDSNQQNISTPSYSGDKPTQDTAKDFAAQQPAFTDKEISSLNKAKDEEDFKRNFTSLIAVNTQR